MAADPSPLDLAPSGAKHANLSSPALIEFALRRREGELADSGAFNALTGERTARSPEDKYIVREPATEAQIDWAKSTARSLRRSLTACS